MMRRTVAALEKLVIVESPNKVIKVEGLLSDPNVIQDWSFRLDHLKPMGVGAEKAVSMATTGHFMALKEIHWTPRSSISLQACKDAVEECEIQLPSNGTFAEFTLEWQMLPGRRIQETLERYMQEKISNLTEIILATDPDREGELIAVHALQTIKRLYPDLEIPFSRAYMHSITEDGIRKAMRERLLDKCDYNLANAAETRHAMDRVFGFLGSSVVRAANAQMRSIGRVQTPALILINDREEKISAFLEKNKATYAVEASCQFPGNYGEIFSRTITICLDQKGDSPYWETELEAKRRMNGWKLGGCSGFNVPNEPVITSGDVPPPQPLTMATAIAMANRLLKMSSEEVSTCLQELFQLGHITYPRTDSTRIDESALPSIYSVVKKSFGKEFLYRLEEKKDLDSTNNKRLKRGEKKTKKTPKMTQDFDNVEDAHEAIRPTNINADGKSLSLPPQTRAIYNLVRRRTLAAFMIPMRTEKVAATVKFFSGSGEKLYIVLDGKHVAESGWSRAFHKDGATDTAHFAVEEDEDLNRVGARAEHSLSTKEFDAIANLKNLLTSPKLSRLFQLHSSSVYENRPTPPLHYSEGSLIEELKNNGVGRPSTYPVIVKTLLSRGYIEINSKGRCQTTSLGRLLVSTAKSTFPSIVDIRFTSTFEKKLDLIAKPNLSKRSSFLRGSNLSQADFVLSTFLLTFLNYVTAATKAQRVLIVERSMRLKHGKEEGAISHAAELEESIAAAKKKVVLATADLTTFPKVHHKFSALQRALQDYLRCYFHPVQLSSAAVINTNNDSNNSISRGSEGDNCDASAPTSSERRGEKKSSGLC